MSACTFPSCPTPATTRNRADQETCEGHRAVVVGRDVDDGHTASEAVEE